MKNTTTITNGQPKWQKGKNKEINEYAPRIAELYNMNKRAKLEKKRASENSGTIIFMSISTSMFISVIAYLS